MAWEGKVRGSIGEEGSVLHQSLLKTVVIGAESEEML